MPKFSAGQTLVLTGDTDGSQYGIILVTGVNAGDNTYSIQYVTVGTMNAGNYYVGETATIDIGSLDYDAWYQIYHPVMPITSSVSNWSPMPPNEGPPLPRKFKIYWPWYKGAK